MVDTKPAMLLSAAHIHQDRPLFVFFAPQFLFLGPVCVPTSGRSGCYVDGFVLLPYMIRSFGLIPTQYMLGISPRSQ
jgi:hypothetical protein